VLDALILDLGNVLAFHDNALLFRALGECFDRPPERFQAELEKDLWDRVNLGELPGDALRVELNRQLGTAVSRADFEAAWSCHFTVHHEMVAVVDRLVGRLPLVLLSNTHDLHVAALRPRLPVLQRFDALVLSCEVRLKKPDPRIYREAVARSGAAPGRCAFFDDVETYARAATAQGLHGRVFTTAAAFVRDLEALGVAA